MTVDIAKIRAQVAGITPGPWEAALLPCECQCYSIRGAVGSVGSVSSGRDADAAFIAAAPTLVAALADECERLRGEVEKMRPVVEAAKDWWVTRNPDEDRAAARALKMALAAAEVKL